MNVLGHEAFGKGASQASLSRCKSWRGRGFASGLMAATVRPKKFPLRCADSSRGKFPVPAGPPRCCGPFAALRGAARPSPA